MKQDSGCLGWVVLSLFAAVAGFGVGTQVGCAGAGGECDTAALTGFLFAFIGFFASWMAFIGWRTWQLRRIRNDSETPAGP